ncbi:MAG TPA: enoyl-CoA hydratase-related protein, partial [Opitutaceae bacterium]
MSFETILVDTTPRVVTITLNRPERNNSINGALLRDIAAALEAAERSATCRAVVLQGRPGLFCTGMDFVEAAEAQGGARDMMAIDGYMGLLKRFAASPKAIIAKLDGKVVAGGVGFAAACDLVVATPRTEFSLSEALWGILPCCVIPFLIRRVGFQKAYAMTLTTRTWPAAEAAAISLVDEVTEAPEESIRKLMLRLGLLEDETVLDLKNYFRKMWMLSPEMEQAAVAEISRLVEKPRVRKGISDYVATGRFPWEGRP